MSKYFICGVGEEKPGIVAALSEVLYHEGAHIEYSSMTLLGAHFMGAIIADLPEDSSEERMARHYKNVERTLGVRVFVQPVTDPGRIKQVAAPYMITVAGHNKPELLFQFSKLLSEAGVLVTDVNAQTLAGEKQVIILMIEAIMPESVNVETLEQNLAKKGEELDVEVTYHPVQQVAL